MANFDERAKEHADSAIFESCIVPENVIGKNKDNTKIGPCWVIGFYYVNRMVNICFMYLRAAG
jgi:hypothetical protein